jgi:uncharacterized protein
VFLTQSISKHDFSEIKQAKSDKKVYVVDNGLLNAIDFSVSKNKGKLLENMVAMEFLKRGKKLFYYKNQTECDFIVQEMDNQSLTPVQVSLSLKEEATRSREIKGLVNACNHLKTDSGTIITMDEEETITVSSCKISIVPFYKYFAKMMG